MRIPALAALAIGCADPPCADGYERIRPGHCAVVEPPVTLPALAEPAWAAQDALTVLQSRLRDGWPAPHPLKDAYLEQMTHGDAVCPGSDTEIVDTWLLGCTADTGWRYAGVSVYEESTWDDPLGPSGVWWAVGGDFEIRSADGDAFTVGGHASYLHEQTPEGYTLWAADVTGSWSHEGADSLAGEGLSAMMLYEGLKDDRGESLLADGAMGIGDVNVSVDTLSWSSPDCWDQPSGTLAVRDPGGRWWTLVLSESCTGCGALSYADLPAEPACIDLSGVADALTAQLGNP